MDLIVVAQVWRLLKDETVTHGRKNTIFMTSTLTNGNIIPGIVYHKGDKKRFVDTANDFFDDKKVKIMHDDEFFIHSGAGRQDIIKKFHRQLLNFSLEVAESANPVFTPNKVTYSGKAQGADDLACSIMMGMYYASIFMWSPKYTSQVKGLPYSTTLVGARHNAIISSRALSLHPGTNSALGSLGLNTLTDAERSHLNKRARTGDGSFNALAAF